MGVHADTETYKHVKALLGIPEHEPIFILRAQDELSETTISKYGQSYRSIAERRNRAKNPEAARLTPEQKQFSVGIEKIADEFYEWQDDHDDVVKFPD
jgi:hypothetical protein